MIRFARLSLIISALFLANAGMAFAAGGGKHPHGPKEGWSFEGPFGMLDKASVQRGYQVYTEVCASCHSMKLLSYRNLGQKGGPFYDKKYPNPNDNPLVKAFAAEHVVIDGPDDAGDMFERPAIPSDAFVDPYANEALARALNGGAMPPDLSVIIKARHAGPDYVYSLMTGYPETLPEGLNQPPGQYYNPYMPGDVSGDWSGDPRKVPYGGFLAMAPQLMPERVEYMDGTEATPEQMAHDVVQFLVWASAPKQEMRKSLGFKVMIFLAILSLLTYLSYRQIWRNVDH